MEREGSGGRRERGTEIGERGSERERENQSAKERGENSDLIELHKHIICRCTVKARNICAAEHYA